MPRKLTLVSITLNEDGSIPLLFGLDIVDGGERIHRTPLRRIIDPDGVVGQNLNDISDYTEANGYGPVTDRMRSLVYQVDAICREDDEIELEREHWVAAKPPPMPNEAPSDG